MSRTIPLTRGYVATVDDSDYEWLNQWKWCANVKANAAYAYRTISNGKGRTGISCYMHRLILGIHGRSGIEGDHRNGDTLDNRRVNLRLASRRQNARNQHMRADNTSGVRGVDYVKKDRVFRVRIYGEDGEVTIGYTKTLGEAKELRKSAEGKFYDGYVRDAGGSDD